MSESKPVDPEEMKRAAAFGAYSLLKDNLPKDFTYSEKEEDDIIIAALTQHGIHLSTHTINQEQADPLKLLCWIGGAIIASLKDKDKTCKKQEEVLTALIDSLEQTLMLETGFYVRLNPDDRNLIHRLAMEEIRGNSSHGIGFNGMFLAFHSLRATYHSLRTTISFPPFAG
ncbi:MAG TPA: hypothetical protein VNX68_00225 [Nitrosopumilaceae archaeon]|jgi:hypothetical protein|nr:hypothetical protein [Nitrosopumilaceae archaeon]